MANEYSVFIFKQAQFDSANGVLTFNYNDSHFGDFQEQFILPEKLLQQDWLPENQRNAWITAINRAIQHIFWMAGVSYYKTQLAKEIQFKDNSPTQLEAVWLTDTWQAGLAELAHCNNLPWLSHIQFNTNNKNSQQSLNNSNSTEVIKLPGRTLVAIGGGKDSLVTIERLRAVGEDITLFQVGSSPLIAEVANATGLPLLSVKRQVDARLSEVNQQGAYNGHVPITAINSTVAVLCALLGGFDTVVFSNERSADSGNITDEQGRWINHQYSKSWAFESQYQDIVKHTIGEGLDYFSLMRPYSELAIVKQFSQFPQYFSVFSSCNRNFHLGGSQNQQHRWCGQCPKCAFVFITLAPFISRAELLAIFSEDLLVKPALKDLFLALFGVEGDKPFECVGEALEARAALYMLKQHPDWSEQPVLIHWLQQVPPPPDEVVVGLMQSQQPYNLPKKRQFQQALWL